jgi:hypothetical protein
MNDSDPTGSRSTTLLAARRRELRARYLSTRWDWLAALAARRKERYMYLVPDYKLRMSGCP